MTVPCLRCPRAPDALMWRTALVRTLVGQSWLRCIPYVVRCRGLHCCSCICMHLQLSYCWTGADRNVAQCCPESCRMTLGALAKLRPAALAPSQESAACTLHCRAQYRPQACRDASLSLTHGGAVAGREPCVLVVISGVGTYSLRTCVCGQRCASSDLAWCAPYSDVASDVLCCLVGAAHVLPLVVPHTDIC